VRLRYLAGAGEVGGAAGAAGAAPHPVALDGHAHQPHPNPTRQTYRSVSCLGWGVHIRRVSHSGPFDEPENEDKNDCPDSGNNNASKQAPTTRETKNTKKKSSDQSPQYSNNDVSNYAEATALHKHSCQPPRNQSDQNEPNEFHDFLL
jgi:hypothetical protein